jgi:hypothetical protein
LGAFSFYDASNGDIWFGFNSRRLAKRGWKLTIIECGRHRTPGCTFTQPGERLSERARVRVS